MATVVKPLARVGNKRAGVDAIADRETGAIVGLRPFNATERPIHVVVTNTERIAYAARIEAGAQPQDVPVDPPLASDTLRWTLTG